MRMLSELNVNYRKATALSVLPGEPAGGRGLLEKSLRGLAVS